MAQITNGLGATLPSLLTTLTTGGSKIRGIGADQSSNVWVSNLDSSVQTIGDVSGNLGNAGGLSLLTGLINAPGFGCEY